MSIGCLRETPSKNADGRTVRKSSHAHSMDADDQGAMGGYRKRLRSIRIAKSVARYLMKAGFSISPPISCDGFVLSTSEWRSLSGEGRKRNT